MLYLLHIYTTVYVYDAIFFVHYGYNVGKISIYREIHT